MAKKEMRPLMKRHVAKMANKVGKKPEELEQQIYDYSEKYGVDIPEAKKLVFEQYSTQVLEENVVVEGLFVDYEELDNNIVRLYVITENGCDIVSGLIDNLPEVEVSSFGGVKINGLNKVKRMTRSGNAIEQYEFNDVPKISTFDIQSYKRYQADVDKLNRDDNAFERVFVSGRVENIFAIKNDVGEREPILLEKDEISIPNFRLKVQPNNSEKAVMIKVNSECWDGLFDMDDLYEIVDTYDTPSSQAMELQMALEDENVNIVGTFAAEAEEIIFLGSSSKVFTRIYFGGEAVEEEEEEAATEEETEETEEVKEEAEKEKDTELQDDIIEIIQNSEDGINLADIIKEMPEKAAEIPNAIESMVGYKIYQIPDSDKYKVLPGEGE